MNKSNFDESFREKFKDFGEVPDEKVWDAIASSLDKRQKKRVIPIWWKLGGIAAILAVLFYIVNPFGKSTIPAVVDTETIRDGQPVEDRQPIQENAIKDNVKRDTEVAQKPENGQQDTLSESPQGNGQTTRITSAKEQLKVPAEKDRSKFDTSNQKTLKNGPVLATTDGDKAAANPEKQKGEAVVGNNALTDNLRDADNERDDRNIPKGINEKNTEEAAHVAVVTDNVEKKSIFDEIDQEEEIVAATDYNKWSVGPSVAPVYFSSFGEGSPIHSNFVPNAKSGNLNLSYGLSVSYAISKKLSVRSGIHKVDYGYDTNDVQFSSSLAASTNNRIDNIDYALTSKNLVVKSSASGEPSQDPSFAVSNEIAAPTPTRDGRMVQQFGYIEVPMELNYALVDNKFGVNLIGGVSSLFLVDNTVSLESNGAATDIGEANNINSLNFSTNIGFGVNYELTPQLQLHLEPMFKYQLNTFSDTSGSFQPFSVGVYSGLNFKF